MLEAERCVEYSTLRTRYSTASLSDFLIRLLKGMYIIDLPNSLLFYTF